MTWAEPPEARGARREARGDGATDGPLVAAQHRAHRARRSAFGRDERSHEHLEQAQEQARPSEEEQ